MVTIIFVRHGQSEANLSHTIAKPSSKLTDEGKEQAVATARTIEQFHSTHIVSSPMARAEQTAEIIADELAIKDIKIIEDLRERNLAHLEGKPKEHSSEWYCGKTEEGCESVEDLMGRTKLALDQIRNDYDGETVIVVGHGVSGFFLSQIAKGHIDFESFDPPSRLNNGEYLKIEL